MNCVARGAGGEGAMCVCMMCMFVWCCECGCVCLAMWCVCVVWCSASIVEYEIVTFSVQNYKESTDKSQNIVEQANSNPNNTSLTMSRRHIICNSSILTE